MVNALNIGLSGLSTAKTAVDNVSNNIANENTEGYIKRVTNLGELVLAGYQSGVEVTSVERQANEYLKTKLDEENTSQVYLEQLESIYNLAETIFSETDETGLSVSLDNFFQDLESLRSDPSDVSYLTSFESSSEILIENLQSVYNDILDLEESLKDQTYDQVDDVNSILEQIVEINSDIQLYDESNNLLDKRDYLESQLAEYVDIEVNDEPIYQLDIAGETAVYNNLQAYEISVADEPTTQKNVYTTSQLDDTSFAASGGTLTLILNNTYTLTIDADITGTDDDDVKRQIIEAINTNSGFASFVEASLSNSGNLIIESKAKGEEATFDLTIVVDDETLINENEDISTKATNNLYLKVLDKEIELNSGSLKALTENLNTSSERNYLSDYKQVLNDIAYMLVDTTSSYVETSDGEYIYGEDNTQTYTDQIEVNNLNIFSGSSVLNINLNSNYLNSLTQSDLDYLASIQWKDDFKFGEDNAEFSFNEVLQNLRVKVSSTKESIDIKLETQESITVSLQSTYDELTKVDTDEEMIYMMKYQAAYEANAKVISTVDEMLQTLLDM